MIHQVPQPAWGTAVSAFGKADTNGDGALSEAEFVAAYNSMRASEASDISRAPTDAPTTATTDVPTTVTTNAPTTATARATTTTGLYGPQADMAKTGIIVTNGMLDVWPNTKLMAISIVDGTHNSIKHVKDTSQFDSVIGVNGGAFNEVAYCDLGGRQGQMTPARGIWTLATERALVHHNWVHHSLKHTIDFDAFSSSGVAFANLCEDNGQEGIFVEESAHDNLVVANTCVRNNDGIAVYSMGVGPVKNNVILGNNVTDNKRYGIAAGGYGHSATKHSESNLFVANVGSNNMKATYNAMHGVVEGDYWVSNQGSAKSQWPWMYIPHPSNSNVSVFQP